MSYHDCEVVPVGLREGPVAPEEVVVSLLEALQVARVPGHGPPRRTQLLNQPEVGAGGQVQGLLKVEKSKLGLKSSLPLILIYFASIFGHFLVFEPVLPSFKSIFYQNLPAISCSSLRL